MIKSVKQNKESAQALDYCERNYVFVAYLDSVKGTISEYTVEILSNMLVIKSKKGKVKLQLNVHNLATFSGGCETKMHISNEIKEQTAEATNEESKANQNNSKKLFTVKLKVKSDKRKVRRIFLRTKKESEAFINAILKAQGYASQLMQYRIKGEIERTQQSAVMYAKH